MKIGIDARLYGSQNGGIGRYLEKLIFYLEKLDTQNQYYIFFDPQNLSDYTPQNPEFKKIPAPFRAYSWAEQRGFNNLLKKHKLDLMHFPHFNLPYFYKGQFVLTIHDLIPWQLPTPEASTLPPWKYKMKLWFAHKIIQKAVAEAKCIICPSHFTEIELNRAFPGSKNKVKVIYESVDPRLSRKGGVDLPKNNPVINKKVLLRYNIDKQFLLYVGNAYPHKNLESLLKVFSRLCSFDKLRSYGGQAKISSKNNYQLVLAGRHDYFYTRLEQKIKRLGLQGKVIITGWVDEEVLEQLYRQAKIFVFPSFAEGFGLPPLEAMGRGLPVVASQAGSLPEILGNACHYFDPTDLRNMEEKISQVLENEKLRQSLIFRGQRQVNKYSWDRLAQETREVYLV